MSQVAWAAGLFEGEGCITAFRVKARGHAYRAPRLSLCSTDEDVARRFHAIVGCGSVRMDLGQHRRGNKVQWHWAAARSADILRILDLFAPYLGVRRTQRADEIRALIAAPSRRVAT